MTARETHPTEGQESSGDSTDEKTTVQIERPVDDWTFLAEMMRKVQSQGFTFKIDRYSIEKISIDPSPELIDQGFAFDAASNVWEVKAPNGTTVEVLNLDAVPSMTALKRRIETVLNEGPMAFADWSVQVENPDAYDS